MRTECITTLQWFILGGRNINPDLLSIFGSAGIQMRQTEDGVSPSRSRLEAGMPLCSRSDLCARKTHTYTARAKRDSQNRGCPKHTLHFPLNKNCSSCFQRPSSCKIQVRYLPITRQQQMDKVWDKPRKKWECAAAKWLRILLMNWCE